MGLRPESVGVGGGYGGYWVVNNGKIVNAYLSAGTRYKLCVDGSSQDTGLGMGGINLDITFVPCPPNDNWAGPTPVTLQTNVLTGTVPDGVTLYTNYTGSVASHNIGATYEGGEYPINNYSSQGAPGRSVWFSFTAPASGYLKIDPTKSALPHADRHQGARTVGQFRLGRPQRLRRQLGPDLLRECRIQLHDLR